MTDNFNFSKENMHISLDLPEWAVDELRLFGNMKGPPHIWGFGTISKN